MSAQEIDISTGWDFVRSKINQDWMNGENPTGTESVDLPHCWNTWDTFQEGIKYYRGFGCYRKRVSLPASSANGWYLELGPFYGGAEIWVDGAKLVMPQPGRITKKLPNKTYDGGFLGFVTHFRSDAKEVLIVIQLDNRHHSHRPPGIKEPDFVLHGGLSGKVSLRPAYQSFLATHLVAISAKADGWVSVKLPFRSYKARGQRIRGKLTVLKDGKRMAEFDVPKDIIERKKLRFQIEQPKLWSPDHPHLYTLRCDYRAYASDSNEGIPQSAEFRFGFRDTEWRPNEGFFLNGKRVELRGINRHEKMPGMGSALTPGMHREDARLIKEMGLNAVRLSHYPQSPDFLNACDELGILVYAEIATWKSVKRGKWLNNARDQLMNMIFRDRNHPSVICWGLGNESQDAKAYRTLHDCARSLDPDRPTIYAENHLYRAKRKKTFASTDLYGNNYELIPEVMEEARDLSANQLLLISEMSNCPEWRGDIEGELRQVQALKVDLEKIIDRPYITGFMIWCMNDYATMRKDRYRRPSGVLDAWRMPKFSAHYLHARFNPAPYLYAWADASIGGSDQKAVHVFTNQFPITIGEVQIASGQPGHVELHVPFANEALTIQAGEERLVIEAFGKPHSLRLRSDPHEDFTRVVVSVVDENGHPALSENGTATVQLDGDVDHHAWNLDGRIDISRGEGVIYLGKPQGRFKLSVEMDGLESAELQLGDI